jgi:hypothetical protein
MKPQPETPPDFYWWRMWTQDGHEYAERRYSKLPSEARKQHSDDLKMRWAEHDNMAVSALINSETRHILSGGRDLTPISTQPGWQDAHRQPDGRINLAALIR